MDPPDAALPVAPGIPDRGLETVCSLWSGRGQLWGAVAAVSDPAVGRSWTSAHVRARAYRVLFSVLAPTAARLPAQQRQWVEALPAQTHRRVLSSPSLRGRVDWQRTRETGWPPRAFVVRLRERRPDTLLVKTLAWVVSEASRVLKAAPSPSSSLDVIALSRLQVLTSLGDEPFIAGADGEEPVEAEIRSLAASGSPWRELGAVARELVNANEQRLADLARTLLAPDKEIRWRLFHLAVLGEAIAAFRDLGANITSTGALGLGDASQGPAFVVRLGGQTWHIWFEAAGIWKHLGLSQPYQRIRGALPGQTRPLGADVLIIDEAATRSLFVECKYSADPAVVGRGGYHQASTYLVEAEEGLAGTVVSVAVGPSTVVTTPTYIRLGRGVIGFCNPEAITGLIADAVAGSGRFGPASGDADA